MKKGFWLMMSAMLAGAAAAAAPLKIVCFGDSITGQPNLRSYLKYSFVLDAMLEARLGPGRATVINRGIGGDTTTGALRRLPGDVLAQHPDITVVLLGGNDAAQPGRTGETRRNLTAIVRQLKEAGSRVLLMQYHLLPNPEHPERAWQHLDDNNDLIAEVAAAEQVPLLDLAAPMRQTLEQGRTSELRSRDEKTGVADWREVPLTQEHLVNAVDGVHLNPGGELVVARAVFRKLLELGWIQ